uniref:dolichyl-phosphooligosaccharide-protein glycotransferase n=1 Tax=Fervidicoccus fontis TaxID=683846 RepID=A0A7J3ZJ94_9CREN
MKKSDRPPAKRKARKARRREERPLTAKLVELLVKYKRAISVAVVLAACLAGAYLRLMPALKYGLELHGNDPWIEYWLTRYVVEHGVSSWYKLAPDNPDTRIFWYPWGRDFTRTEYPLIPIVAAVTYPIGKALGFTLKEWVALQPVVAGFFTILLGYLLVRELAGDLAGIIAAMLLAFTPGAIERTIVGFVEKIGFSMPIYILSLYLLARFLKRKRLAYATASGLTLGLLAWSWGGWQALQLMTALVLLLYPLYSRVDRRVLAGSAILALVTTLLTVLSPVVGAKTSLFGPSGALIASSALLMLGYVLELKGESVLGLSRFSPQVRYAIVLVGAFVIGVVAVLSGYIYVSGRILYLLGTAPESPLAASVAEHQTLPLRYTFNKTGIPLLLAVPFLVYATVASRRSPELLVLLVPGAVMAFLAFRSAYLMQAVSTTLAMAGGATVHLISRHASKALETRGGRGDDLGIAVSIIAVFAVTLAVAVQANTAVAYASTVIPTIKAGGTDLVVENNAWIYALSYIRENTDKNSVVIAWWDYGYWISVVTGRATVADGATLNATQIELLAKALTAESESEALDVIFNKFRAPQNSTYLVIFDVFRTASSGSEGMWLTGPMPFVSTGTEGRGDIPKSVWMLRISGKLGLYEMLPYFTIKRVMLPDGRMVALWGPDWQSPVVQNTLIYRLFVTGVTSMGFTWEGGCANLSGAHMFVDWMALGKGNLTSIWVQQPEHFKPVKTFVDCIFESGAEKIYVAVFIFKVEP